MFWPASGAGCVETSSVTGELDEMLSERKKLSADVQIILDAQTETLGIKVSNVDCDVGICPEPIAQSGS